MFGLLSGFLAKANYERWPMMGWDQSSEAARLPIWGYGHMAPGLMGWGLQGGGFFYYLMLGFGFAVHVLLVAILVALLRWLWKKGS